MYLARRIILSENSISLNLELDLYGKFKYSPIPINLRQCGDVLIVKGVNGAGKSTLLKTLSGHYAPNGSSHRVLMSQVSYCGAQARGMLYHLSGRENLKLYFRYQGMKLSPDFENFFLHPNFKSALSTPFKDCSSGMKKMLLLCFSLLTPAEFYILDEPLAHLDDDASEEVLGRVQDLLERSSVIAADHTGKMFSRFACKLINLSDYQSRETIC